MKPLKTKIRDIAAVKPQCQHCQTQTVGKLIKKARSPLAGKESKHRSNDTDKLSLTTEIKPLQPQIVEAQPQQIQQNWQRLAAQAKQINQLAAELEKAMQELKAIAIDLNCQQRSQQKTTKPVKSACEYLATVVPCVKRRKAGGFVLTTRRVDLFLAEREARKVAQTLRRRTKRSSKNKLSVLGWLF